jgi:hypothetical protein
MRMNSSMMQESDGETAGLHVTRFAMDQQANALRAFALAQRRSAEPGL